MEMESNVLCFFLGVALIAFSPSRYGLLAVPALESTQTSTNTRVPPCIPEISYRASVFSRENKVVSFFAMHASHEDTEYVFCHCDHPLITVLRFAKVDDPRDEV